ETKRKTCKSTWNVSNHVAHIGRCSVLRHKNSRRVRKRNRGRLAVTKCVVQTGRLSVSSNRKLQSTSVWLIRSRVSRGGSPLSRTRLEVILIVESLIVFVALRRSGRC